MLENFENPSLDISLPYLTEKHKENVHLVHKIDQTFDSFLLSQRFNQSGGLLDVENFNRYCNKTIDLLLKCGKITSKQRVGYRNYLKYSGLKIIENKILNNQIQFRSYLQQSQASFNNSYQCLGFVIGKNCLSTGSTITWLDRYSGKIAKFIQRPEKIRDLADNFLKTHITNPENIKSNYISLHFRFDSDWLEMCKRDLGASANRRNQAICYLIFGLQYDRIMQDEFLENIYDLMNYHQIEYIYFATTPNNKFLVDILKREFTEDSKKKSQAILTFEDLSKFLEKEEENHLISNYYLSLVEQEICMRAHYFLGSALSSWSQTILLDRLSQNITLNGDILKILAPKPTTPPGYPPFIFQFPEGGFDFKFRVNNDTGFYADQEILQDEFVSVQTFNSFEKKIRIAMKEDSLDKQIWKNYSRQNENK